MIDDSHRRAWSARLYDVGSSRFARRNEDWPRSRSSKLPSALQAVLAPPPPPRWVTVHADLPAAARWFLENVRPEPQKGAGKVKEKMVDRFRKNGSGGGLTP